MHGQPQQIAQHRATCERRHAVLAPAQQMLPIAKAHRLWIRHRGMLMGAAGLGGVAVASSLAWNLAMRSSHSSELQALVEAIGTDRRIEPRLAGGFAYGPLHTQARSPNTPTAPSVDLTLAAAQIEKASAARRSAHNLHNLGVAYLVTGAVDRSITTLEDASRETGSDGSVLSDLAAAYLVRGLNLGRREDIAKAASRAEKATVSNPSFAEALFNRGLAFEALALRRDARDTWERYLQLDSRSSWATEAHQHLRALADAPESLRESSLSTLRDPTRCRDEAVIEAALERSGVRTHDYFEDELLPSWADAYVAGQSNDATHLLECARALATVLARDADAMELDAVNAIDAASRTADTKKALAVARAHRLFRDGRRLFEESHFNEAGALFADASTYLQQSGSRFELEARYFEARSAYRQQRIDEAASLIGRLIHVATPRGYWYLLARLHRLRGVIEESRSRLAAALEDYRIATTYYERIRDPESAAGVHNLMAEHLQTIGEPRESWDELFRALSSLRLVSSPLQRYQILWMAIQKCMHDDLPDIALHFENAFLDNALSWPSGATIGAITNGQIQRARVHRALGDLASAEQAVIEARRTVGEVHDSALAERWKAEILIAEGENWVQSQPVAAVTALTDVIDRQRQSGSTLKLPYLFLLRGRAQLNRKEVDQAEADFQRGIDAFEVQHHSLDSAQSRISHFDESWDVFADMIRLKLQNRNRPDDALSYVERGRAQTLLESVTRRPDGSAELAEQVSILQRRIPRDVAVLSFATLKDELATWVITDHSVDVVRQEVPLASLNQKTAALLTALTDGNTHRQKDLLIDLYDVLIRPISTRLDPTATSLVIIPDGPLNSVPFAALIDGRTDRYLIEDRAIGTAPSLAVFIEMSHRAKKSNQLTKLLVIGDPSIDRRIYPNLADLRAARAEALEIAGMFRGAELLLGQNATKAEFLKAIRRSDVVHFAGHAVANQEFPWLSRLLFAPGPEAGSDTLFSQELAVERLDQLKLVVLAACSTGAGAGVRGEGVLSLARAFIAAGAPTVVGSLWDISDPASQRLFSSFYKFLRSGESPLAALRDAQLVAIASGDATYRMPVNWAGFAAIGGVAAQ
jgi:CHAT domain-containing protein